MPSWFAKPTVGMPNEFSRKPRARTDRHPPRLATHLGRQPTDEELNRAVTALKSRGLKNVCWLLLNSTEFCVFCGDPTSDSMNEEHSRRYQQFTRLRHRDSSLHAIGNRSCSVTGKQPYSRIANSRATTRRFTPFGRDAQMTKKQKISKGTACIRSLRLRRWWEDALRKAAEQQAERDEKRAA